MEKHRSESRHDGLEKDARVCDNKQKVDHIDFKGFTTSKRFDGRA